MHSAAAVPKKLKYFYLFEGELIFVTPLHIAGLEGSIDTDAPLLRDAEGDVYIPGTSVMGPLRARAHKRFPGHQKRVDRIFGSSGNGAQAASMSRLFVEDAYPKRWGFSTTVRDGVAIDRKFDSAAPGAKYDLETTPRDMTFALNMRLELREDDPIEEMAYILQTVLQDFKDGRIGIGGGKTRGLGRCCFKYNARILDFSELSHLLPYLLNRDVSKLSEVKNVGKPDTLKETASEGFEISVALDIKDSPLLIKHGRDDGDFDAVFTRVAVVDGTEVDYIPGGSLKGVFRARAEKILRTLGGNACAAAGADSCAQKIKTRIDRGELTRDDAPAIKAGSCPICRLFGNTYLGGRIAFDDAFFDDARQPGKKEFNHVAIDRFTGGAVEGKLFDAYSVVRGKIRMHLFVEDPTNFDKVLILMILRDIRDGFPPLRFGYGKSKGNGLLAWGGIKTGNCIVGEKDATLEALFASGLSCGNWWMEESHA